ncbi:MAG TPA: AAA family ATPase, partial [Candidatus Baltobacteraceae bacterium]|nr:AAA family ATPase [Candidatus Baltobacteraceae bacterium]
PSYQRHHHVRIEDAALDAAAALTARYIVDRFLPDKAIDAMDEAAAGVALRSAGNEGLVGPADIAAIVSSWSGVPQGRLTDEQSRDLLSLETELAHHVIGQIPAVTRVAEAIRRGRAGLKDPRRPVGSFLFVGPGGVGKTELARTLSRVLFGTDQALVRLDLSEYTEANTVSRLLGAPPGYAGHDEAGHLTEQVRRRPYCVILLDEFEKAHPDIASILLHVLDEGRLTDAKGRTVDFRHAIVILTANDDDDNALLGFRTELLDRLDEIVHFQPLGLREIEHIVELQVGEVRKRLGERRVRLLLSDEARRSLAETSLEAGSGARYVSRTISRLITTPLSAAMLRGEIADGTTARIELRNDSIIVLPA